MRRDTPKNGTAAPRDNSWAKLAAAVLLGVPVAGVLFPTALLLAVVMLPTLVAYLVDRTREKFLTLSVGLLNAVGSLVALVELWSRGQSLSVAGELLADPMVWLVAYGAAGAGWLVVLISEPLVITYFSLISQTRLHHLQRRQQALLEEWGPEVAGERKPADTSAPE